MSEAALAKILKRLEEVTARLEKLEGAGQGAQAPDSAGDGDGESPKVAAYQAIIDEFVTKFVSLSEQIGDDVAPLGKLVSNAAEAQKALIKVAAKSKKPSQANLAGVLGPLSKAIQEMVAYRDANRASKNKNHLFAVAESAGTFGWVAVEPTPGPYVKEMASSAQFYTNKILREFKGKDQKHVDWAGAYTGFLKALFPYIKQHHTTGLSWNPRGGDAEVPKAEAPSSSSSSASSSSSSSGSNSNQSQSQGTPTKAKGNQAALFSELSKGTAVTSGLRKVKKEERNKGKKISGVVKAKASPSKALKKPAKPAVLQLVGNKWAVEYQVGNNAVVLDQVKRNHTVYIYRCENSVIQIKGKVNSICIDGCKKVGVVFDQAIATCELVNCQSVKVQVVNTVPSIAIDKTAGASVILSKTSLHTSIVASTSSELNVVLPPKDEKSDPKELPIPEQFTTTVVGDKLQTVQVDHTGG